jgi:hypothetical protein
MEGECLYEKGQTQPNNKTCPECIYFQNQSFLKSHGEIKPPGKPQGEKPKRKPRETHNKPLGGRFDNIKLTKNFEKIMKSVDSKKVSNIKTKREPFGGIKIGIASILKLHPSFWRNPKFLQWQLMRLNKDYREYYDLKISKLEKGSGYQLPQGVANVSPKETLGQWYKRWLDAAHDLVSMDTALSFVITLGRIESLPFPGETFEKWSSRVSNNNDIQSEGMGLIAKAIFDSVEKKSLDDPIIKETLRDLNEEKSLWLPYIHPDIRFPLPFLLELIPSRLNRARGPIQNWPRNLLVYELSQKGIRDTDIAVWLFGMPKEAYRGQSGKNRILSHIDRIKRTISKSVDKALPYTIFNSTKFPPFCVPYRN